MSAADKPTIGRVGEPKNMIELTHTTFDAFVASHRFVVVHFWASWNRYDAYVKAFLEKELPVRLRELIAIGTMEVDPPENHQICLRYPIPNIPFFAFYRDGSLVKTLIGADTGRVVEQLRQLASSFDLPGA